MTQATNDNVLQDMSKAFAIDFRGWGVYIWCSADGMVAENLEKLRNRIEEVCRQCGRSSQDVRLVAVSKTFGVEGILEAREAGQIDFGENYVQELRQKRESCRERDIRWHFIGHLQSNKVKYIAEYVHLIHSVDSRHVAEELDRRGEQHHRVISVLLEVHTTDEETKTGIFPAQVAEFAKGLSRLKSIRVDGLMTMGPLAEDPESSRSSFRELADIGKKIEREGIEGMRMKELSMGMSNDFEVAIQEGATIVRIGTAIFGKRRAANLD